MQSRIVSSRNRIRASAGVTVLIVLACGLCGLVAYQWYRDADLRMQIADRNKQIQGLNEQKHEVEVTGKRVEEELKRVEQLKERLTEQDKTNKVELSRTKRELSEMTVKWERATKQGEAYKAAYDVGSVIPWKRRGRSPVASRQQGDQAHPDHSGHHQQEQATELRQASEGQR
ncbi:MAG: hypothetical protein EBU81_02810 [Proteobacteria bacterium]|nr:hypothetical protein [Pseudomonadota bacterium]